MKRNYNSGISEQVDFFIGREVERTPAYGMKTLFVVGLHDVNLIENMLPDTNDPIKHIFFGANHSYNPVVNGDWIEWENMISYFLEKNYWCSLDIPLNAVNEFHDGGLCEYNNFIPQIRIALPYVRLFNYNTTIKIDDKGFNQTNPGVWVHSLHSLMDHKNFTDWSKYNNDEILK